MKLPRWIDRVLEWLMATRETCPVCGRRFLPSQSGYGARLIVDHDAKPGWVWGRVICARPACEIEAKRRNVERYQWDGVLREPVR